MDDALKRARRIRDVLGSVARARRVQLIQIERKARACAAEQEEILNSFTESDRFAMQFADLISKRLSALFHESQRIEAERRHCQQLYRDAAVRERVSQSQLDKATLDWTVTLDNKSRSEVIEVALTQALGKSMSSD